VIRKARLSLSLSLRRVKKPLRREGAFRVGPSSPLTSARLCAINRGMKLEPKTTSELQALFADLSGHNLRTVNVFKVGNEGDFGVALVGHSGDLDGGSHQSRIETIRDELRLKYRLED
jgi:hypothetical protein